MRFEERRGGGWRARRALDGTSHSLIVADTARHSTKSLSGHALGAAGVHEAIYCLIMMQNDFMAESANIENLVDEAEGMNILTDRKDGAFKRVMSNSFGFGGTNCALVFDKFES